MPWEECQLRKGCKFLNSFPKKITIVTLTNALQIANFQKPQVNSLLSITKARLLHNYNLIYDGNNERIRGLKDGLEKGFLSAGLPEKKR